MIILRKKNYSTISSRLLKLGVKTKDRVVNTIDNLGLATGERLGINKQLVPENFSRFKPSSNTQLNRKTIQLKNKIEDTKNELSLNPGGLLNKGVQKAIENPVTTVGNIGDLALSAGFSPIGELSRSVEVSIKDSFPGYNRFTKRLGDSYRRNSKLQERVEQVGNTVSSLAKNYIV